MSNPEKYVNVSAGAATPGEATPLGSLPEENSFDPELEKAIEHIDFDTLRQVCEEKLRSLGVVREDTQFVDKEKLFQLSKTSTLMGRAGMYDEKGKAIGLNVSFANITEKLSEGKKTAENTILSILCHEEAHGVSHQSCSAWEDAVVPFVEKRVQTLGFVKAEKIRLMKKLVLHPDTGYILFNEGVTEILGNELFDAYNEKKAVDVDKENAPQYMKTYPTGRFLVNTVVNKIAQECELEKDTVQKAIQKGYVLGEDIGGDFMKRLFKDVASDSLISNLKDADGAFTPDFVLAIAKIKMKTWSGDDRKRVRRWFKHLEAVTEASNNGIQESGTELKK